MVSFFYSPIKFFLFFVIPKERSDNVNPLVIAKERTDCGNLPYIGQSEKSAARMSILSSLV